MTDRARQIEARWVAATPGPWDALQDVDGVWRVVPSSTPVATDSPSDLGCVSGTSEANAKAIAAAAGVDGDIAWLLSERKRLLQLATDRQYFIEALVNMLGPIALKVWQMWQEKKVSRVHYSWGEKFYSMSGEERAAAILKVEEELKAAKNRAS